MAIATVQQEYEMTVDIIRKYRYTYKRFPFMTLEPAASADKLPPFSVITSLV